MSSVFNRIRASGKRLEYPPRGECRVCGEQYDRDRGGRKGMCASHYRVAYEAVKKCKTTWDALHDEFPMVTGRGVPTSTRASYAPPAEAQRLLESEFQNAVVDLIIRAGHGVWVLDPIRKKGVPDILVITDDGRVLFRELKASGGTVERLQEVMMERLQQQGQDVAIWRPEDLDNNKIEGELRAAEKEN